MKKRLTLEALEVVSFKTSTDVRAGGRLNSDWHTCMQGCSMGPDCVQEESDGCGTSTLPCTE